MTIKPVFLDLKAPIARDTPVAQDRLERGHPLTGTLPAFESKARSFYVGQWASDIGQWRVSYSEEELCIILEGSGALIDDDGTSYPFKAGDAFVIPAGFTGHWKNDETIRKIYAIVE